MTDEVDGTEMVWSSVVQWAAEWFRELRAREYGEACYFIEVACGDAVAGVVDALVILAETAQGDEVLLGRVGAGPLEALLSHSGHGARVLADVDRAARQNIAFRSALGGTWLGSDVPVQVRDRLAVLGARVLDHS